MGFPPPPSLSRTPRVRSGLEKGQQSANGSLHPIRIPQDFDQISTVQTTPPSPLSSLYPLLLKQTTAPFSPSSPPISQKPRAQTGNSKECQGQNGKIHDKMHRRRTRHSPRRRLPRRRPHTPSNPHRKKETLRSRRVPPPPPSSNSAAGKIERSGLGL